jgi:hypothetical protein
MLLRSRWRLAGLAGAVAAVALAFQPWRIAELSVQKHLLAQLASGLAVSASSSGGGAFALLPTPRIIARQVTLASADGSITAMIPQLKAEIRVLSLLDGRIEFNHVALTGAQIEVRLPDEEVDPIGLLSTLALAKLPDMPRVTIGENASLFLRRGIVTVSSARDIAVEIAARKAGDAVEASGAFSWRGENVAFAAASNSPARGTLPMARVRSEMFNLDFTARRSARDPQALEGPLLVSTNSMSRLGFWLSRGAPTALHLGAITLRGEARLASEGVQVSNAALTLGADALEGGLDWRKRDGRWRFTGTFAGRSLDIGRPSSSISPQGFAALEPGSSAPIDIDDWLALDLDIRLSLNRVRLPNFTMTDVAGQILANDQRLDVSLANATLYRGTLRGRASIGRSASGVEIRSQLAAERVDLALLSGDVFEVRRVTGLGAFQHSLEMTGRSMPELIASAHGRMAFTARNGDFMGADLNDVMRRIDRQPLVAVRDWRGGRTSFEALSMTGVVNDGVMEMTESKGAGPAFRLNLDGRISLVDRYYRLRGDVTSTAGTNALPFEIIGNLSEPVVQVNTRGLIERSGAATPFLPRGAN